MPPRWIFPGQVPPDPTLEEPEAGEGLVAVGGVLDPATVLAAYRRGVFPWSSDPVVTWWCPDPRAIFDLETWRPHRTILRSIRRAGWRLSVDEAFDDAIHAWKTGYFEGRAVFSEPDPGEMGLAEPKQAPLKIRRRTR